jgi:zinc transporter 9
MEELGVFLILCGTMFFGSYAAGFVPLAFTFSESKVRLLSILGAGLLVGTALSVILPEGVEALQPKLQPYVSSHHKDNHIAKQILEENSNGANDGHPPRIVPKDAEMHANVPMDVNAHGDGNSQVKREKRQIHAEFDKETGEQLHTEPEEHHDHKEIGPTIGYSLVFGFILMLLVDQITKSKQTGRQKLTATVGLVVHSAVDGIALGSASMVNKSDIQLIVFVAIMLHKAPASFGLTTILMVEGLERSKIKKHLFVFSSAAPIGALLTYFLMPKGSIEASSSSTGIMLLFSAGTFLYVATVHVLPELAARRPESHMPLPTNPSSSTTSPSHSHQGADFTCRELIILIIGSLLPSILASGHHH